MWWFYCHIKEQADCINISLTAKNSKAGISKMLMWENKLKLEIHNGNDGGGSTFWGLWDGAHIMFLRRWI